MQQAPKIGPKCSNKLSVHTGRLHIKVRKTPTTENRSSFRLPFRKVLLPDVFLWKTSANLQHLTMLEEHKECLDKRGSISKIHSNEYYTAVMEEDLQRIEDLIEKHGSNFLIEPQGKVYKEAFCKVNATMLPSYKILQGSFYACKQVSLHRNKERKQLW